MMGEREKRGRRWREDWVIEGREARDREPPGGDAAGLELSVPGGGVREFFKKVVREEGAAAGGFDAGA